MNPAFPALLAVRNQSHHSVPLEWHTNGTLITPSLAQQIVEESRVGDRIYVSIDGGQQAAHELNRGYGTWARSLEGLRLLLDAKEASNQYPAPEIGIYQISWIERSKVDPELVLLGARCDVWTRVSCMDLNGIETGSESHNDSRGACFWSGNSLCIAATGAVHVCLLSYSSDGILGNIFNDSITELCTNASAFRNRLNEQGRHTVPHCAKCRKPNGDKDGCFPWPDKESP
jgi:sulfatase maturation enzyme AslB (radical SAM superfamily)